MPEPIKRTALYRPRGTEIDATAPPEDGAPRKLSPRSLAAWNLFQERVAQFGGEVVEPEWRGATVRHRVRCPAGHESTVIPHLLLRRRRLCFECPLPSSIEAWRKFQAEVARRGGEVLDVTWRGNRQAYAVRCNAGHVNQIWPIGLHQGHGICLACAGQSPRVAWEGFQSLIEQLGGVVVEEAWKGKDEPHACLCPQGHECSPRPGHIRRGIGMCLTCAGRNPDVAMAAFRARVKDLGGEVLEPSWLGNVTPHRVRCSKGHESMPAPSYVQQGGGICRACAGKTWDVFYVVADEIYDTVKFGITSGDPRPRLKAHARDGFDCVIRLIEGLPGDLAPRLERAILAALREARESPVRGAEYFPTRTLGLILDLVDGWTSTATPAKYLPTGPPIKTGDRPPAS